MDIAFTQIRPTTQHCKMLLVLIMCLMLNACSNKSVCLTAEDIMYEKFSVDLHGYPEGYSETDNTTLWSSAISHTGNHETTITITGEIDLCGLTSYDTSKPIAPKLNSSIKMDLHKNSPTMIQTDWLLFPEDTVSFYLQHTDILVDCDHPESRIKIDPLQRNKCKDGFSQDMGGGNIIQTPPTHNTFVKLPFFTDGSNSSNVIFWHDSAKNNFIKAKPNVAYEYIFPSPSPEENKIVHSFTPHYCSDSEIAALLPKVPLNRINQMCNRICNVFDSKFPSLTQCAITRQVATKVTNKAFNTYIPMVSGAVYDSSNRMIQRLPDNGDSDHLATNITGHSYVLEGNKYPIQNSGKFAVGFDKQSNRTSLSMVDGGYALRITRECTKRARSNLVVHKSRTNNKPTHKPGTNANDKIVPLPSGNQKDVYVVPNTEPTEYLFFGIRLDPADTIDNNKGLFTLMVRKPRENRTISKFIRNVEKTLTDTVFGEEVTPGGKRQGGVVNSISEGIIQSRSGKGILWSVTLLYFTIYPLLYMLGAIQANRQQLSISILKALLIVHAFTPSGWNFYGHVLNGLFIGVIKDTIVYTTSYADDFVYEYAFLDSILGRYLIHETWTQITSLIMTGPIGWIAFGIIVYSVVTFFISTILAIVTYIMSITMVAILLAVAPLFMLTLYFKYTAKIFQNWIKVLFSNAVQPLFILTTLALVAQMVLTTTYSLFNYGVCDGCALSIKVHENLSAICVIQTPLPGDFQADLPIQTRIERSHVSNKPNFFLLPFNIVDLFMLAVLARITGSLVSQASSIASHITGLFTGRVNINDAKSVMDNVAGLVGMDEQSRERRAQNAFAQHQDKTKGTPPPNKESRKNSANETKKNKTTERRITTRKSNIRLDPESKAKAEGKKTPTSKSSIEVEGAENNTPKGSGGNTGSTSGERKESSSRKTISGTSTGLSLERTGRSAAEHDDADHDTHVKRPLDTHDDEGDHHGQMDQDLSHRSAGGERDEEGDAGGDNAPTASRGSSTDKPLSGGSGNMGGDDE